MKTDTIFYRLFQSFPSFFFELINHTPEEAKFYEFSSVEVKQLAFRIDGVFLPKITTQPIYFLEVQFQNDNNFYGRFFSEIFLYLSKTPLTADWKGVIIYPSRQVESYNSQRYQELLNSQRVERIYLNELENRPQTSVGLAIIELIVSEENQAIDIATPLIEQVRQEITDEQQQKELLELLETVLIYKLPRINRQEIEAMFSLSDLKQTKIYQEALEEGRHEGRQEGRQEGRHEGRQEGRQEGRHEGRQEGELLSKLASIPRMLKLGLTLEVIAESLDLPLERVREEINKN
ncbi:Rpn family recombination-promoting nuclease/putative transposase [Aphanothece sacrum]|uniref:Flagellar assembly protein H n=1 Tax=Aphanothece sacrum FPU1 TaxID=1920663 RepID=A0A401IMM6_APHSA|nr:Rpn family recombination-promoting nuclease/putative transposase [Aphanothece sacrum]GBF82496.1 hypothetical protein AsFPU1_3926 [Aphanothece sacrum FPU1]GBF85770.1 hypothetical protein AsFPU3_2835 [Aphanothece sacrum FPU3]